MGWVCGMGGGGWPIGHINVWVLGVSVCQYWLDGDHISFSSSLGEKSLVLKLSSLNVELWGINHLSTHTGFQSLPTL